MQDNFKNQNIALGHIRIYEAGNPDNVFFEEKNVIVNTVKSLFARIMADSLEPAYGIWGLAIGSGDSGWGNNPPVGAATQWKLENEIARKRRLVTRFLDGSNNPVNNFTEVIEIETVFNALDDNISSPIRELGLIGGGSTSAGTNMLTAPYWDPSLTTKDPNTVTLINYKTLPTFYMPSGIDIAYAWKLQF